MTKHSYTTEFSCMGDAIDALIDKATVLQSLSNSLLVEYMGDCNTTMGVYLLFDDLIRHIEMLADSLADSEEKGKI